MNNREYQQLLEKQDEELRLKKILKKFEMADWVHGLKPWEVIANMTFVWECSLDSATRCHEKFMKRELPSVSYFYALEANPGRKGYHIHALFSDTYGVRRSLVWKKWFDKYGRNRIEPVKSKMNVTSYVSKYVTKEGAWWNLQIKPDGLRSLKVN